MKNSLRLPALLFALWMALSCLSLSAFAAEIPFKPSKLAADGSPVGDVDKDGQVTQKDRLILTRYLAGWSSYGSSIKSEDAADINGDGKITAMDRLLLGRFLGQWEGYETYFAGDALHDTLTDPFNRFTVTYSAPSPAKICVRYTVDGEEIDDSFFLEAGRNCIFSALILPYLEGKTARDMMIVSAESLTGGEGPVIRTLTGETVPLYASDVLYLENGRYKIGVKLSWGGGISEIYDKKNPVQGLGNLINDHDTGRNIQQSYYGTDGNDEYIPGECGGITWPYNPVQGGNVYDQASRLIDVRVGEDAVRIVSQPADWAIKDDLTPSYMMNTFTLSDDFIRVDNRFVDFSGWEHLRNGQEIPALYCVTWLKDFVWYAGDRSWTGDALSWDEGLSFWDNDLDRFTKRIYRGQTETWGAWVNKAADYGLGMYVPGADTFVAKRSDYPVTMDADDDRTNYFGPIEEITIVSYEPIEYSYLMAAGSVSEIRSVFSRNRDFAVNGSLSEESDQRIFSTDYTALDFSDPEMTAVFGDPIYNTKVEYDDSEKAVRLTADPGFDPYLGIHYAYSTVPLSADVYRTLKLMYKIPETNRYDDYSAELFLCAGEIQGAEAGYTKYIGDMPADGEWHTVFVDLTADFWYGDIHMIRFDFFNECADGDSMLVKKIELVPSVSYAHLDFSDPDTLNVLTEPIHNASAAYDKAEKAVRLTADPGDDPYIGIDYGSSEAVLSADSRKTLKLTYKIPTANQYDVYSAELFLCAGEITETEAGLSKIIEEMPADGKWHTIYIDLTADFWKGDIHLIRFDFFNECADGDSMLVKEIELVPAVSYLTLDFTDPDTVRVFTEPVNDAYAEYDADEKAVRLTADRGYDPYIGICYDRSFVTLSADDYKTMKLTYKIPQTNRYDCYDAELFLCAGDTHDTEAGKSVRIGEMPADGEWHTVYIDLTADFWEGDIHLIRFDFFSGCEDGESMLVMGMELQP